MGKKIQHLRLERHVSKRQLAEIVGTHTGHITRIEEGKYGIRFETLVSILEALGYKLEIVPRQQGEKRAANGWYKRNVVLIWLQRFIITRNRYHSGITVHLP